MKIENYSMLAESRQIRRTTIWVMLLNLVLVAMIAARLYITLTGFGQTTLAQGIANCVDWIGGAR